MTREDIIRMAGEAGFPMSMAAWSFWSPYFKRYAALVAEAEREAICPIVYGLCVSDNNAQEIVNAIRARGSK
jgi:hypothetical protein